MNTVGLVILVVLAVIGAASVVRGLSLLLFCTGEDGSVMVITRVADCENAEFALRSALTKRRWGGGRAVHAVCLDCPLDEKTRGICESVCREYGVDRLMTKEELRKSLD